VLAAAGDFVAQGGAASDFLVVAVVGDVGHGGLAVAGDDFGVAVDWTEGGGFDPFCGGSGVFGRSEFFGSTFVLPKTKGKTFVSNDVVV